jgi:peptide-methionine (S)-S-oxide reductase
MLTKFFISLFGVSTIVACNSEKNYKVMSSSLNDITDKTETATFGTGCFWCTEAIFEQLDGVVKVTSGYIGGTKDNPTYQEVCSGQTGYAEAVQVGYEPSKISYDELLEVFFKVHDPTSLNRQGADVGTQYRSAIFYNSSEQKDKAEYYKNEVDKSGAYDKPIVTEITAATKFYPAENYHQEYYQNNKNTNPYCSIVIRPKLEKFQKVFGKKIKSN